MLLDLVRVPPEFAETQAEWAKTVKELGKRDAKWSKLSVPGSLVRFARTRLELSIMSIPDPKVRMRVGWGRP